MSYRPAGRSEGPELRVDAVSEQQRHREVVSFVRRGERFDARQQRAWDEMADALVIDVPRAGSSTSVDPQYRFDPATVFGRQARFVLEIGSGVGECLVVDAAAHPDEDFLGLEVWKVGVVQTLILARRDGARNLRLAQVDAAGALDTMFAPASVDEVRVFFPDPWPKRKHHKRRLLSAEFAQQLRRLLAPGGAVRIATDWEHYARQIRDTFDAAEGFGRGFDGDWAPRFERRPVTKFEGRGIAEGRAIYDLVYVV